MVLTPMNQNAIDDPKVRKEQTDSIPMKRAANPGEVAELALYLASDAAAYATGASFTLDGGLKLNAATRTRERAIAKGTVPSGASKWAKADATGASTLRTM